MTLLGVMALTLCIFLTTHTLSDISLPGCTGESSCGSVLSSRWSTLMGFLPVGAAGAGIYLATVICLAAYALERDDELRSMTRGILQVLAVAILGASIWFISLQAWKIKAFCPWCMTTHMAGILLSVLILLRYRPVHPANAAFGLAAVALLVVCQLFLSPSARYSRGKTDEALPTAMPGEFPYVGDPAAKNSIELLFDYQCPHCRVVHSFLPEIAERDDIVFVLCPTPLSPSCNAYIPAGEDHFKGSCELARLALAVWETEPESFEDFDSWLFSGEEDGKWVPRSVDEAMEKAISIMGEAKLTEALASLELQATLSKSLEIFGRTTFEGKSGIPRLVASSSWVIPEVSSADELEDIISPLIIH